jgi:MFS family permease
MKKPSLFIIFLTVFVDLIGFGICLPLLPQYAKLYGAEGLAVGLIMSSYSLMQLFFAPWWGQLSDRIGRRPVILISNCGSVFAYALWAFSATQDHQLAYWLLLASRVMAGICGANISVASAYIADVTTPENRSRGMGMIGMAFGLGFILGPFIGGVAFAKFGASGPGVVASIICALNFISGCFILVESRDPNAVQPVRRQRMAQIGHVLALPEVGFLIMLYFLATFSFTCFESTLPLLLDDKFHYLPGQVGYIFAYCGLTGAMVQGGGIGRLVKSFGERKLIWASLVVVALSLVLLPYMAGLAGLLFALAIFSAGSGINRAPTMGLISQNSPAAEQGATLGVAQSAGTLARVLGPLFATKLYSIHRPAPYLACAGIALAAGLVARQRLAKST